MRRESKTMKVFPWITDGKKSRNKEKKTMG